MPFSQHLLGATPATTGDNHGRLDRSRLLRCDSRLLREHKPPQCEIPVRFFLFITYKPTPAFCAATNQPLVPPVGDDPSVTFGGYRQRGLFGVVCVE